VAPLPDIDRSHLLFLRHNDSRTDGGASTNISGTESGDRRRRGRGYRLSAFPVRKSRRNIAIVTAFTNCSRCGTCMLNDETEKSHHDILRDTSGCMPAIPYLSVGLHSYFASAWEGAEYCNEYVASPLCMSVLSHRPISEITQTNFTICFIFLCMMIVAVACLFGRVARR